MSSLTCRVWSAEWRRRRGSAGRYVLFLLIAALLISGCAEKGPILLTIGYQGPEEKTGAASEVAVGVSPLRDARGGEAAVLGKRTIPSGLENDLVVRGTVAEIATTALKKAISSRGIVVKDTPGWDLTLEGMKPPEGTALLLGGEIRKLWLESTATALKTHLRATVQLKIVAGYRSEEKVVRTIEVSSTLDEDVLYSQERLEQILTEALSSAIDQIFKDAELKKLLQ